MIVIRVELWSAITGEKTELARMHISNVGGTMVHRNYAGVTFKGRSTAALDREQASHQGEVHLWPAQRYHVWNLVAAMLRNMGYNR